MDGREYRTVGLLEDIPGSGGEPGRSCERAVYVQIYVLHYHPALRPQCRVVRRQP